MSSESRHAPLCFVAIPAGKHETNGRVVDFDALYHYVERAVVAAGLEPVRAAVDPGRGFVERPMRERLLVAEYVVADLTLPDAELSYEVGLRQGANTRATMVLCCQSAVSLAAPASVGYALRDDGAPTEESAKRLEEALSRSFELAREGRAASAYPVLQITDWRPGTPIGHSKTDVFLQLLPGTGALGARIHAAFKIRHRDEAIAHLAAIEEEVVGLPADLAQVHTALLGVYLGYREKKAWDRMVALFERFPRELQQNAVALEQCALALNRTAEATAKHGDVAKADGMRERAMGLLDAVPRESITSETHAIRGRIYKGWHDTLCTGDGRDSDGAAEMLQKAIGAYEEGFRSDVRDTLPGVNAVTLRLLRGTHADDEALKLLLPAVRYAAAAAPTPENPEERYWQTATRLELATADHDWRAADGYLAELLRIPVEEWFRETTLGNMKRQQKAFAEDADAVREIGRIEAALRD